MYSYGYGSDDEYIMKRRLTKTSGKYSREDFREQYCINEKSLHQLDRSRSSLGLFGCLSSYQDSPCNKRHQNVFTSCYGRHPSDEHLAIVTSSTPDETSKKPREWRHSGEAQSDGEGGFIARPRSATGWSSRTGGDYYQKRYTWDEESHSYIPNLMTSSAGGQRPSTSARLPAQRYASAPLNQMSRKHVSFENSILNRSSTATSFEETKLRRAAVMIMGGSVERLLETGGGSRGDLNMMGSMPSTVGMSLPMCVLHHKALIDSGIGGTSMVGPSSKRITRTQSTQTESFIVRASGPPPYLSLSPRTSYRVRMVSQGAQTNGGNGTLSTSGTKIISKSMSTNINHLPRPKKLIKTLSDGEILVEKKRTTTPYIEVYLDDDDEEEEVDGGDGGGAEEATEAAIVKHKLIDDECFHENYINRKLNLQMSTSVESSHDHTTFSSGDSSSSSGSYSLDFIKKTFVKKPQPIINPVVAPAAPPPQLISATAQVSHAPPLLYQHQHVQTPPHLQIPPLPLLPEPTTVTTTSGTGDLLLMTMSSPIDLLDLLVKPPVEFCDESPPYPGGAKKRKRVQRKFRAKSEERFRADAATQSNISLSLRDLRGVSSSPGEISEEEGVYTTPYELGIWIYIGENEEAQVWKRHEPLARSSSGDSTLSERDFMKRYTALTHRMVHRKASGETYKRLGENSLEITKRLQIHRQGGEFGFRIHGSRPVVVSAVEEETPAEEAGLEVGDVIMSINGVHCLESSHSDVVKLAKGDVLELELARTADVVRELGTLGPGGLMEGRLWKVGRNGDWVERYFHLTPSCLYWYKTAVSTHPLGVLPITPEYTTLQKDCPQDPYYVFTLKRTNGGILMLGTPDLESYKEWTDSIAELLNGEHQDTWVQKSHDNVLCPPKGILNPDCAGMLTKWWNRIWTKRYCLLKDACLYFYQGEEAPVALSAAHLHGYRVNMGTSLGGKKYVFELIPPQSNLRHYYLAAESETERKRWLAALEYSIDRWINVKK